MVTSKVSFIVKNMVMYTIEALAQSQGFYSRLLRDINSLEEYELEDWLM